MDPDRQAVPVNTTFLVEGYWPDPRLEAFSEAAGRLAETAAGLRREGVVIQAVAATLVPADEAAYWIVDGPSVEVVALACWRAGVEVDRIVRAVEIRPEQAASSSGRRRRGSLPTPDRTRRTR